MLCAEEFHVIGYAIMALSLVFLVDAGRDLPVYRSQRGDQYLGDDEFPDVSGEFGDVPVFVITAY
jgi:hypothetical protein